jgi:integrase/recombinase XerC
MQICTEVNAARHVQELTGRPTKRALTRDELQDLFDHADERVSQIRAAGRKGWLAAFRDATLIKVAYAWGLRRNEVRMLDLVDFATNPQRPSSASTAWSMSATARRWPARRPSGAVC